MSTCRISRGMAGTADLLLVGFGTGSGLQLTVEGDATLRSVGLAVSLNAPPPLLRYLKTRGVDVESLDDALDAEQPWPERLMAVADTVLRRMELDPPVILLLPGDPLFLNPLSRFLVSECQARDKTVSIVPAPSEVDIVINTLGLDVGRRGLGLMDAVSAIDYWAMPISSPVVIFKVAALTELNSYGTLAAKLRRNLSRQPPGQPGQRRVRRRADQPCHCPVVRLRATRRAVVGRILSVPWAG